MTRPRLPWRWALRASALVIALGGVVALMFGQAALECVVLEQAALVLAVLSL